MPATEPHPIHTNGCFFNSSHKAPKFLRNKTIRNKIGRANRKRKEAVQAQLVPDTFIALLIIKVAEKKADDKRPSNIARMKYGTPFEIEYLCIV